MTLEAMHDRICQRLDIERQSEYLLKVAPLLETMPDDTEREAYMQQFIDASWDFLLESEREKLQRKSNVVSRSIICQNCQSDAGKSDTGHEMVCNNCGITEPYVNNTKGGLTYTQQLDVEVSSYPYRRANHFAEWCTAFQAKGTATVPPEVYEKLEQQMKRQRITDPQKLNPRIMKQMMKELRLNKYYECIPQILLKLKGEQPPRLTQMQEEQMKAMFQTILKPFDKAVAAVCPSRKNFLSYAYTLRKFSELLELDHLTSSFQLLKSREKLAVQDAIWKHICGQLNWRFIPSI
jgi:hypothetical protein